MAQPAARTPLEAARLLGGRAAESRETLASASIAVLGTLVLVGVVIAALGANPFDAYWSIVEGAFGSSDRIGNTLRVAVPLALCGVAAAIPFTARLWNVGAEGQMHVGAFAAIALALTLPSGLPAAVMVPLVVLGAVLAGAVWAGLAGLLKAVAGANEVIVTLMLNFVGILLATYAITGLWPQGVAAQTERVPGSAELPVIWSSAGVNLGLVLAVVAVAVAWVVMRRTRSGFEIRAIGLNPAAARMNGMRVARVTVVTFVLAGLFAGLAGSIQVIGDNRALVTGFSANYGYIGIAVALVARLNPAWILPSAVLFAALQVGSQTLPAATGISTAVGQIVIATFIIALLATRVIRLRYAEGAVQ
ncbi:MAG: ABC transporter permease [Thermoleophilia bacterium]